MRGSRERGLAVHWHEVHGQGVRSLSAGTVVPGVPEVVLVPGLGALGYLTPLARACASWTRVHLLDVPGFGHRSTANRSAHLDVVAALVDGWLDVGASGPVVLAGHSTGAQAALAAAVASPESVAALVLGGITFPPQSRTLRASAWRVLRTLPHEQVGELPAVLPYYLRGLRRMPELLLSALPDRPEERVRELRVPHVVVRGEHDHLCPRAWAVGLGGQFVELPGAHNAWWTVPEQSSDVLRDAARLPRP